MNRFASFAAFYLSLVAHAAPAWAQQPLHRWVQYVPGGVEARAITTASACPEASINGKPVVMKLRAAPGANYPMRVCSLALAPHTASLVIAGAALPLPKVNPSRILLIGDTGCRISALSNQNCNDPEAWPFGPGTKVEAALKPDLVIHVGDFHYRERACRSNNPGCADSPHGDSWAVWEADFFNPARPLLEAAPFVFVRGNHEECERGGKGWSRTLDPYPFVSASGCLGLGAPWLAEIGAPKLVVMDVSTAAESRASARQVELFRRQFALIADLAPSGPVWVAFHRPIRAVAAAAFGFIYGDNKTLAAASKDNIPKNVQMFLSGHIHTFQALEYALDLPIQIVSGHGGDELHLTAPSNPTGLEINGVRVRRGVGASGVFGFVTLEREAENWRMKNHDMSGQAINSCLIQGRAFTCD